AGQLEARRLAVTGRDHRVAGIAEDFRGLLEEARVAIGDEEGGAAHRLSSLPRVRRALTRQASRAYAAPMKSLLCACAIAYCAIASSGCGSNAAGTELLGSYSVMISSMGKSDPDVMTVSPGIDDKLLLSFVAGVTTDVGAVNANGLRADFKDS